MIFGELTIEPAVPKLNLPLLIVVSPLYVFGPNKTSVPVAPEDLATVTPAPEFPEIIPENVYVASDPIVIVRDAAPRLAGS